MDGINEEYGCPILRNGEARAVKNEEKANVLAKTFVKIHSSGNISEEG